MNNQNYDMNMMTSMNNQNYSGRALSARLFHLKESRKARQHLLEESKNTKPSIDFHSDKLIEFVLRLRGAKKYLLMVRKRSRFPSPPSKVLKLRLYQYNRIIKQRFYHYKPIDGFKYGILLWLRKDKKEEKQKKKKKNDKDVFRYEANIDFMYGLRTGLFVSRNFATWKPFTFRNAKNSNQKYIHVGLAALINGLGIPDSCVQGMFTDISNFAAANHASNLTLCVDIQISTLQEKGEGVLETKLRSEVDKYCRSRYINESILKSETHYLQPVSLMQIQDAAISSSYYCNKNIIMAQEEDDLEEDRCSICLDELGGGGDCSYLPCLHVYHYDCIFKWMSQYNFCPLCRHAYRRIFQKKSAALA